MKTVVITGSSGGIGRAIASKFCNNDWFVIGLDTRKYNSNIIHDQFLVDITKPKEVKDVFNYIQETRNVDCLINNAGITKDHSLKNMCEDEFDTVMNVNVKGTINCFNSVIEQLSRTGGSVINASSVVSFYGNFGQTNYVASKSMINGLTKYWAKLYGPNGVRVNAIAPGFTDTDMTKNIPDNIKQKIIDKIPLRRFAIPEEIANCYYFLASDNASYVNGQILRVDAGLKL